MNILHLFSISIIVSCSLYPVFALDTSQVCDASSQPHYGGIPSSHIYIKDTNGNMPYVPLTNHTAVFHDDDVWNTSTQPRIIRVTLTIQNQDTGQQVFNQTQSLQMKACSGPEKVQWNFVPTQIAYDMATVTDDKSKISMGFISVYNYTADSQIILSPLKQFKSGITANNVICKQGLQLIFKTEDETPVCATPQTGTKLIHTGWAVQTLDSDKPWLKIDILGLNDTYTVGQPIVFSVNVQGFGYYPCVSPQVDIYAGKNPNMPVFHENGSTMSCPILMAPDNYSFDFPSKNNNYVTSINKTGNYAVSILYGTDSVKKYFSVIPSMTSNTLITNPSSSLKLSLSTNSTMIQSGHAIGITLSLDNASPNLLTLNSQNHWPIQGLDLYGCSNSPVGVAILDGYYTLQNMSDGHPMVFHFLYPCPPSLSPKSFTFYPMSSNVTITCAPGDWGPCQHVMQTKATMSYNTFLQDGKFFDFNSGNYTVIAGDEWGDVEIRHFQVVNSTQTYLEYDQPIVTQTYDAHGTINNIMSSTTFAELASSSTGIPIARGGDLDAYDNDNIKLELNYGKTSDSSVISATVENLGKRTVHIYNIFISGFVPLANDNSLNFVVVRGDPYVVTKDDAILEPGESATKYIVGNWTVDGKPVNGFSAGTSYSYDDLQNYDDMTNEYSMSVPVQWVK